MTTSQKKIHHLGAYRNIDNFIALHDGVGDELMKGHTDSILDNEILRRVESEQRFLKVVNRDNGTKDFYWLFKSPVTKIWGNWGSLGIYLIILLLIHFTVGNAFGAWYEGNSEGWQTLMSISYVLSFVLFGFAMYQQFLYRVFYFIDNRSAYRHGMSIHAVFAIWGLAVIYTVANYSVFERGWVELFYSYSGEAFKFDFLWDWQSLLLVSWDLTVLKEFWFFDIAIMSFMSPLVWFVYYMYYRYYGASSFTQALSLGYDKGIQIKLGRWNSLMEYSEGARIRNGTASYAVRFLVVLPVCLYYIGLFRNS